MTDKRSKLMKRLDSILNEVSQIDNWIVNSSTRLSWITKALRNGNYDKGEEYCANKIFYRQMREHVKYSGSANDTAFSVYSRVDMFKIVDPTNFIDELEKIVEEEKLK